MGLLDSLPDWLPEDADKRDAAKMGLLGMGAAMLSAPTANFLQALGSGVGAGATTYAAQRKANLDQKKEQLQMAVLQQQANQLTRKNSMLNGWMERMDAPVEQQALAGGAMVGDVGPTVTNAARSTTLAQQPSMYLGVPKQAIFSDLALNDGKNVGEWIFKQNVPNMQVHGGYAVDMNRVQPGFLPTLNISQNGQASLAMPGADGLPVVTTPAGALETFKGYKGAEKRAENENTLAPLDRINPATGRPYNATVAQLIDQASGAVPPNFYTLPTELRTKIQGDANSSGKPVAVNMQMPNGVKVAGNVAPSNFPGFAGPADVKKMEGDVSSRITTTNNLNENWIKQSYNPILSAGDAARNMHSNLDALQNIDVKTGWGTEGRAAAANVLTGLGLSSENAKMFAANAQKFQSIAMDNLWQRLNEAKGPQTEGDASRAKQVYASLQNTPEANQFIVDLARARANWDAKRASYYKEALPLAQRDNDLPRVDREWSQVAPSIWSDPVLQKYVKRK